MSPRRGLRGGTAFLRVVARNALRALDLHNVAVTIVVAPDRTMRHLKLQFLRRRTPADVLAFPEPSGFPHPEERRRLLGEVYLNRKRARGARGVELLIHGLLHLLGYTHETKRAILKMRFMERRLRALMRQRG